MILIGTMNLTRTRDRGNFYCPTCAMTQEYRLRARRPWLTLYFIPTVPVGGAELFVQCDQCRSVWDPTVLDMDRTTHEMALEEQFREEALRAAVLVVLVDNRTTDAEITALARIGERLLERELDREELGWLCSIAQENKVEAANYVLTVSKRWTSDQRSVALQAMFLAATAEEKMTPEKTAVLTKMRDILEMTDFEYESAIEEALTWERV